MLAMRTRAAITSSVRKQIEVGCTLMDRPRNANATLTREYSVALLILPKGEQRNAMRGQFSSILAPALKKSQLSCRPCGLSCRFRKFHSTMAMTPVWNFSLKLANNFINFCILRKSSFRDVL